MIQGFVEILRRRTSKSDCASFSSGSPQSRHPPGLPQRTGAEEPRDILWPLADDARELAESMVGGSTFIANTMWRAPCRAAARAYLRPARADAPLACSDL